MDEQIPRGHEKHVDLEITYYQYMPLILLFMAFLFKVILFVFLFVFFCRNYI